MTRKTRLPKQEKRYLTKSGLKFLFIKYKFKSWRILYRTDLKLGKIWGDGKAFAGRFVPLIPNFKHKGRLTNNPGGMAIAVVIAVLLFSIFAPFLQVPVYALNNELVPNADYGTMDWTASGSDDITCGGGTHCDKVGDGSSHTTAGYISLGEGGTDGEIDEFDMTTLTNVDSATGIVANIYAQSATNANGGTLDDVTITVYINGSSVGSATVTPAYNTWTKYSTSSLTGSWSQSDIDSMRIRVTRVRQGGGGPSSRDDDVQIASVYADVEYTSAATTTQTHFRWRDDDYTVDVDNGWLAVEDSNSIGDIAVGTDIRLRFEIDRTGPSVTDAYRLEWTDKGTGSCSSGDESWVRMDTASDEFALVDATNLTNGTTIATSRLTGDNTTFVSGESVDSGSSGDDTADNITLQTDEFTEVEFAFEPTSSVTAGSTYCFRVSDAGTAIDSYSVYPEMTFTIPLVPYLTQEGYVFENDDGYGGSYSTDLDFPTVGTNFVRSGGGASWTNPSNITNAVSNASAIFLGSGYSDYSRGNNYGFNIPTNATIDGIEVEIQKRANTVDLISDGRVRIYKTGIGGTDKSKSGYWSIVNTTSTYGNPTDLWGETWTASDINNLTFGAVISADAASIGTAYVNYIKIKVYYTDGIDSSVQAGTNFTTGKTLSNVRQGESINLRTHISNTGGPISSTDELALFYDRNDGIWTKAQTQVPVDTSTGDCTDTDFTCEEIDDTGTDRGENTSVAVDPSGNIWISYIDATNENLMVARYVGTGGSGCTSSAWSCETVSTRASSVGEIAINDSGKAFVVYHYRSGASDSELSIAEYVGSDGTNCASSAWRCEDIDASVGFGGSLGANASIAFDTSGNPWVAYAGPNNSGLNIANHDGSWNTSSIEGAGAGVHMSIAFSPSGVPWVSYYVSGTDRLEVAIMNGTGSGSCSSDSDWNCEVVDDVGATSGVGQYSSIAFSPEGKAWIAYYDVDNTNLKVAERVDSGGSGCTGADNSTLWNCGNIDSGGTTGEYASLSFAPDGNPWVSYYDAGNTALKLAEHNGTSWSSTTVDNSGSDAVGQDTSLAFDASGDALISYYDGGTETSLAFAQIDRAGEILLAPSVSSTNGDVLSESHADMTSATDTTNQDDADCISAGASWNDGIYYNTENGAGLTLPAGTITSQCTEIVWTLDTSQAVAGETYRFVVASKDAFRPDKGPWRGPISVATDGYPTLTISSDEYSTYRYSKDAIPNNIGGSDCTDTDWTCEVVDVTGNQGYFTASAMNPLSGTPWITWYDQAGDLMVAEYVGDGTGTGCDAGSTDWTCTIVDATDDVGEYPSIAFDRKGTAWISYYDGTNSNAMVAKYVGSGGTGCDGGSTAWTCTAVDVTSDVGSFSSIAIDASDNPWISYYDPSTSTEALVVAQYVGGTGGTGCAGGSTAWTCTTVDAPAGNTGQYTNIAFGPDGIPWVSYRDSGTGDIKVAKYVGSGSTSCVGGSSAWDCTTVDATDDQGYQNALTVDGDGVAWVSYSDHTNDNLMVAQYVGGTSGTGCDGGSTAWECSTIQPMAIFTQASTSIVFGPSGEPWISFSGTSASQDVAKLKMPIFAPTREVVNHFDSRNAGKSELRYMLSSGLAPYTDPYGTCGSIANLMGYCGLYSADGQYDSNTAGANELPMYQASTRYDNNSELPYAKVAFRSSIAPSSQSLKLQVYRYGTTSTTNTWEDVATYSSAGCITETCFIEGNAVGTSSEYYESDGGDYWVHYRVYQESGAGETILYLDSFTAHQPQSLLRAGRVFREGVSNPLN